MSYRADPSLPPSLLTLLDMLTEAGLARHIQLSISDRHGRILYASEAFCAALGYANDELLGHEYRDLKSGLHGEAFFAEMWKQLQETRIWKGEIANRGKDGRPVWMDLTIFPLAMNDLGQDCFVGVGLDATERKRAELAHRKAENVLEQIVQGAPVPTFVINAQHEIIHWNRALEALTGIPAKSVIGTSRSGFAFYGVARPSLADLIVDNRLDELDRYYTNSHRKSPIIPDAYEAFGFFPKLTQGDRWLTFTAAPLRDTAGRVMGAIETLQDVTERKVAENQLKQSQVELEVLVEKRTEELARAKAALEADIVKRRASENELQRRNDELTEVNERLHTAQQQLAQSERLASIGQLAAGVAHEINNPIGYIQSNFGTLETYLRDLFDALSTFESAVISSAADDPALKRARAHRSEMDLDFLREDVPALMAECKEGISRVRKIVDDLKDFSRTDTSQGWEWADLHRGLESTLNIVNNEIKYKADVIREYGALPEIECLPSRLNQVFMNLLVNAAHAVGPQRGTITVRTGCSDTQVWVEVSDDGCGMSTEQQARIFDPFFTTKAVGQGTGLGLSLSYGIVMKHSGHIDVTSQQGCGSTFRVVLPIRQTTGGEGRD